MKGSTAANAAIAGVLGSFCAGVYGYTMMSVGKDDLAELAEMEREAKLAKAALAAKVASK
jgi:hypothetical protein